MDKTLHLALPVMLHDEVEIAAFKEAQDRIRRLGDQYSVETKVGAFLPYMPGFSRKPRNLALAVENQAIHQLPLAAAEPPIYGQHSLFYGPGALTYDESKPSGLVGIIDQVGKVLEVTKNAPSNLILAPHLGPMVTPLIQRGDFSKPGVFSPEDFDFYRDRIWRATTERFSDLKQYAKAKGVNLGVEYAPLVTHEIHPDVNKDVTGQYIIPLNTWFELNNPLFKGSIVFDVAHWAASHKLREFYESDRVPKEERDKLKNDLFRTLAVNDWDEYQEGVGGSPSYIDSMGAAHISQADGIGFRPELGSLEQIKWNPRGTELVPRTLFYQLFDNSRETGIPLAVEEDYVKFDAAGNRLPIDYKEADAFLEPLFQTYAQTK